MRPRLAGRCEVDDDIALAVEAARVPHIGVVVRRSVNVVVLGPADAFQVDADARARGSRLRRHLDNAGLDHEVRLRNRFVAALQRQRMQTAEVQRNRQRRFDASICSRFGFPDAGFLRREAVAAHTAAHVRFPHQLQRCAWLEAGAGELYRRADRSLRRRQRKGCSRLEIGRGNRLRLVALRVCRFTHSA